MLNLNNVNQRVFKIMSHVRYSSKEHPGCAIAILREGMRPYPSLELWDGSTVITRDGRIFPVSQRKRVQLCRMLDRDEITPDILFQPAAQLQQPPVPTSKAEPNETQRALLERLNKWG